MMPDDSRMIRSVAWEEIFPWLMLPRALRFAASIPALFVATVGVLLMPLGWWGVGHLFVQQPHEIAAVQYVENLPLAQARFELQSSGTDLIPSVSLYFRDFYRPMVAAAQSLADPLRQLLRSDASWSALAYWTLGGLWNLLVWGFFGGILTRMAIVQYGCDQREGLVDAARFVGRRLVAFVGAPLFALAGVALVLALSTLVGYLTRWEIGFLLVSLLWFFVLIGGLISTIFVIGVFFGWPLMWGALSAEELGDVFEATQRTFSYAFGRPLHYAFYALVAIVVGSAAYQVAELLAQAVIHFSFWAVSWGVGPQAFASAAHGGGSAAVGGGSIITVLNAVVLLAAEAFRYSFLFTAAGVTYLLIRRDSDRIELDVVHRPQHRARYSLPPLSNDEATVPGVDEPSTD